MVFVYVLLQHIVVLLSLTPKMQEQSGVEQLA